MAIYYFLIGWLIFTAVLLLVVGYSLIVFLWFGAPYVRAKKTAVAKIIELAEIKPGQKVFDLGAGDGQFLIAAEARGAEATGYEVSPWAYFDGWLQLWQKKSKAQIKFKNFLAADLSQADVLICFLVPRTCLKLAKKLDRELQPGTKLISYAYPVPFKSKNIKEKTVAIKNNSSKIYIYERQNR